MEYVELHKLVDLYYSTICIRQRIWSVISDSDSVSSNEVIVDIDETLSEPVGSSSDEMESSVSQVAEVESEEVVVARKALVDDLLQTDSEDEVESERVPSPLGTVVSDRLDDDDVSMSADETGGEERSVAEADKSDDEDNASDKSDTAVEVSEESSEDSDVGDLSDGGHGYITEGSVNDDDDGSKRFRFSAYGSDARECDDVIRYTLAVSGL